MQEISSLSVFDLDHTLLNVNTSFEFGRFLYRHRFFSTFDMLFLTAHYGCHKFFGLSVDLLHQRIFQKLFKGRFLYSFKDFIESFINLYVDQWVNLSVMEKLLEAQKREHVVLLSNSPHFIVGPIAERFKISLWAGARYEVDHELRFSHISRLMKGKDKAEYVSNLAKKMAISHDKITVYTDSHLDLPLLEMAGNPIAVNPDPILRKICAQKKWKTI